MIDAFGAWQKRPLRRTPSPGQHRSGSFGSRFVVWVAFGRRFGLAYLDKGIEVALIGALLIEQWRSDGGPVGVDRRIRSLVRGVAGATFARNAR